jgi:hypothetical protein
MRSMRRLLTLVLVLAGSLLLGCGNQQKGEMMLGMEAMAKHPAFMRAMSRLDLAGILAGMDLTAAQAAELRAWAADQGSSVRGDIEGAMADLADLAPKVVQTADEMVRTKAVTADQQQAVAKRVMGDQADAIGEDSPPINIAEIVAAEADGLKPLAAKLSDRQQLVLVGAWQQVAEAVKGLLTCADQDSVPAMRGSVTGAVINARNLIDPDASDAATKKLEPLVNAIPTGQVEATGIDAHVAKLFAAVPAPDQDEQLQNATTTLATLLSEEPAAELLALVQ